MSCKDRVGRSVDRRTYPHRADNSPRCDMSSLFYRSGIPRASLFGSNDSPNSLDPDKQYRSVDSVVDLSKRPQCGRSRLSRELFQTKLHVQFSCFRIWFRSSTTERTSVAFVQFYVISCRRPCSQIRHNTYRIELTVGIRCLCR